MISDFTEMKYDTDISIHTFQNNLRTFIFNYILVSTGAALNKHKYLSVLTKKGGTHTTGSTIHLHVYNQFQILYMQLFLPEGVVKVSEIGYTVERHLSKHIGTEKCSKCSDN